MNNSDWDNLPDARDGLSRKERIVLYVLQKTQEELRGRNVPTAMLYGRVVEHIDMSPGELQDILHRFTGASNPRTEQRYDFDDDKKHG